MKGDRQAGSSNEGGLVSDRGRRLAGLLALAGRVLAGRLAVVGGVLPFVFAGTLALAPAFAARPAASVATSVRVAGDEKATSFELLLSTGVPAEIYTLANPYRVIIDLPDVAFKLPPKAGQDPKGLITAFRYGLFAEGKARVVIDTQGPIEIAKAGMTRVDGGILLKLSLKPTDAVRFGGGTGAARQTTGAKAPQREPAPVSGAPKKTGAKPVIVIDAGHGGIDPGTISPDGVTEKTVVLAVAKRLREALQKGGRYVVHMTRSKDVFVSLDERVKISADVGADLFISLHADALEARNFAESVRGATIYTLSERASDEQAQRMAEKENASDLIAGLETASIGDGDQVRTILIDLLKRETSNFSADFSNVLLGSLRGSIAVSKEPQRSAAFKVLKQADAPSVLVELGYMSNSKDEAEMTKPAWQARVAQAIGSAVNSYFRKRQAQHP